MRTRTFGRVWKPKNSLNSPEIGPIRSETPRMKNYLHCFLKDHESEKFTLLVVGVLDYFIRVHPELLIFFELGKDLGSHHNLRG